MASPKKNEAPKVSKPDFEVELTLSESQVFRHALAVARSGKPAELVIDGKLYSFTIKKS